MAESFRPARSNLGAFEVEELEVESTAEIDIGAPLQRNDSDASVVEEHAGGDTVTGIIGVALQGTSAAGTPDFGGKVQVAKASQQTAFIGRVLDTGADPDAVATVAGDGTYLGNEYGMIKSGDVWYVDEDDTTDVVLTVIKELPERNAVLFKFLASAIAD